MTVRGQGMMKKLFFLGYLRTLLLATAALVMLAAAFAGESATLEGWRLLTSVVAPAAMLVLVFVILLDLIMLWVFLTDAPERIGSERRRLYGSILADLFLLLGLFLAWGPYFVRIFTDG